MPYRTTWSCTHNWRTQKSSRILAGRHALGICDTFLITSVSSTWPCLSSRTAARRLWNFSSIKQCYCRYWDIMYARVRNKLVVTAYDRPLVNILLLCNSFWLPSEFPGGHMFGHARSASSSTGKGGCDHATHPTGENVVGVRHVHTTQAEWPQSVVCGRYGQKPAGTV